MTKQAEFRVIADDPDLYKLAFSTGQLDSEGDLLNILSQAIYFKLNVLLSESKRSVFSAVSKSDLFEPFGENEGFIEIDTLLASAATIALDAYLYTSNGILKGKASCSVILSAQSLAPGSVSEPGV